MTLHTLSQGTTTRTTTVRRPDTSRLRRIVEVVAFVTVWVTAGYLLPIGSDAYLLLGIPLTAAFQVVVRRRPLRELFASGTARFALGRKGVAMAAALAVLPGVYAAQALAEGETTMFGWYLAAMAGAVAAAFSLREGSVLGMVRHAALPIAIGSVGMATVFGTLHVVAGAPLPVSAALAALVTYSALYFPATFLLEEVAFRGAVDAHLHHDGEDRGWQSAVLVSALWGLWHLPVSSGLPLPLLVAQLVVVHVGIGVPLSFAWRRTRNLAAPALAHAVIDAVRNAAMLGL